MRTDQLLREAMADLAGTARTPETALPRILARIPTPAATRARSRRRVLVVALAAVLLIAAVAVPTLTHRGTAEPADTRAYGNWNLVHRVDLPPGWEVTQRAVAATSESSSYRTTAGVTPATECTVEVLAAGRDLSIAIGTDVGYDVNGRTAGFGRLADEQIGRVYWAYAKDSDVSVGCGPIEGEPWGSTRTRNLELDFARRVVFEPNPIALPFRLTALPAGYQVHDVDDVRDAPGSVAGVQLAGATQPSDLPLITITVNAGTTEVKPGLPGYEVTTINGLPAVLSATEGSLCLNVREHTACISAGGGKPADLNVSLWPAGQRELLVEVADHLTLAKHLDDPTSWPDANHALPR